MRECRDARVIIKLKRLTGLLLLFVNAGALLSSCSANTPLATPTNIATPSLESLTPTKSSTPVNGIYPVLLIDEAHKDAFLTDPAKIVTITLEKDVLKFKLFIKVAVKSIPLNYMPRQLSYSHMSRRGYYIYPTMRMATRVPRR